ncbi:hypothetical protein GS982_32090 [Rhodococcus hoagii]|nr:hypothetical protein [Prescottella equi]
MSLLKVCALQQVERHVGVAVVVAVGGVIELIHAVAAGWSRLMNVVLDPHLLHSSGIETPAETGSCHMPNASEWLGGTGVTEPFELMHHE